LEVREGTFVDSAKATTVQWRKAASKLRQARLSESERDLVLRPVCQMVSIAEAVGVPDHAALLAVLRTQTESVAIPRKPAVASLTDLREQRPGLLSKPGVSTKSEAN